MFLSKYTVAALVEIHIACSLFLKKKILNITNVVCYAAMGVVAAVDTICNNQQIN